MGVCVVHMSREVDAVLTVIGSAGEVTPLKAAVMEVDPAATPVTTPLLPTVAVPGFADVQATDPEMSAVLLFEYVPVAVNLTVSPVVIDGEAGAIVILVRVADDGGGEEIGVGELGELLGSE